MTPRQILGHELHETGRLMTRVVDCPDGKGTVATAQVRCSLCGFAWPRYGSVLTICSFSPAFRVGGADRKAPDA